MRAGIVVVVAAGNNGGDPVTHDVGYAGITSPGNAPSAITVGAFDTNDTAIAATTRLPGTARAGRRGTTLQKPDIVAPGHHAGVRHRHDEHAVHAISAAHRVDARQFGQASCA